MDAFKGAAPRYFQATGKGKRPEHIMMVGGRDGPEVADLPPKDPKFWSGGESARWTVQLEEGGTPGDARTQSPFLREVRPEQRLWEKGFMKVSNMLNLLETAQKVVPVVRGAPERRVEFTLLTEDGNLASILANVYRVPVYTPLTEGSVAGGAPTDLLRPGMKDLQQFVLAAQDMQSVGTPVLVALNNVDGKEITILLSGISLTLEGLKGVYRYTRGGQWRRSAGDGSREVTPNQEVVIAVETINRISLFDTSNPKITDTPYWARLNGALIGVIDQRSGAETQVVLPFNLVARTKIVYPQAADKPPRKMSEFTKELKGPERALERAARHLTKLRDAALYQFARSRSRSEDMTVADPRSGYTFRLTPDGKLAWGDKGPDGADPRALLQASARPDGAILVTPDNYLRITRAVGRKKGKERKMFTNPIRYLSPRELEAGARYEGLTVAQFLQKYPSIKRSAERPARQSRAAEPAFLSAGYRAAASGAGLRITRRNSGWDPTMYEIEPGIVYEPDVHAPPEFVSNPFHKVTEPGPGKIQVTSKRGKTLYMTPNQIAKMGSKMLAPGEVERALSRSNPRTFRGEQTPERRKRPTKDVARRTAERKASRAGELAAYGGQFPQNYVSPDMFKGPARGKYPAGHQGSAQRQRKELAEFSALLPDIPVERLKAMDIYDIIDEMDARGVMHPTLEGMAMAHFIRENPRTFGGGMSGAQRSQFAKKRSERRLGANMDRAERGQDADESGRFDSDEQYDADFKKAMAQLGMKANSRRR